MNDAVEGIDDFAEFKRFAGEFKSESDRAAVILGAAKLDVLLYQLLQKALRPCTSKTDELLEGDAPLGTFSARTLIAHRLGLIDDELFRAINLVRRIRNSFAHELSGISLDSGAHRDRIRELVGPLKEHGAFKWILETYFTDKTGPSGEFRAAVALMALRLEGQFESETGMYSKDPQTLIPKDWDKQVDSYKENAPSDDPSPSP